VSCVSGVSYPGPLPSNPQGAGAEIKGDDQAPERLAGAFGNDFFDSIDPSRNYGGNFAVLHKPPVAVLG
jgi:hypothetical protein